MAREESEKKFVKDLQNAAQEHTYEAYRAGHNQLALDLESFAEETEQYADSIEQMGIKDREGFVHDHFARLDSADKYLERLSELTEAIESSLSELQTGEVITEEERRRREAELGGQRERMLSARFRTLAALRRIREAYKKR